jgi:hypothetical protein
MSRSLARGRLRDMAAKEAFDTERVAAVYLS